MTFSLRTLCQSRKECGTRKVKGKVNCSDNYRSGMIAPGKFKGPRNLKCAPPARTQMTRPNGVTSNYTYNNLSQLLSVLHQVGASTIDGAVYTVDPAGNRTAKTDKHANITSNYTYDPLYELTQVMQSTTTTETYSYDPVGNRLSSLGVSPYSVNTSNELTSIPSTTYTYDSNGNTLTNLTSSGTTTFGWDYENRLTSVTLPGTGGTLAFKYDGLGRRIQKAFTQGSTTTTTNYLYDGNNAVADVDQNGNVLARYTATQNIDEPLAELRSGTTSYYSQDGLGSVTSLTSSAGALGNTYTYDSFGKLTASTGSIVNRFQYTGREADLETGLYFYRTRYYDTSQGRFLAEDSARYSGVGSNLYGYVDNNPTDSRDPLGLCPTCIPWSSLSFLQKAILNGLSALARRGGGVRGLGAGGAAAFSPETRGGGGGSGQAAWVADYLGQQGLYWSTNGGPTAGEAGVGFIFGLQYLTSTTNTTVLVQDVVNSAYSIGGAAAAGLGAGVEISPQTKVVTGTIGVGLGGWGGSGGLNIASGFIPICP